MSKRLIRYLLSLTLLFLSPCNFFLSAVQAQTPNVYMGLHGGYVNKLNDKSILIKNSFEFGGDFEIDYLKSKNSAIDLLLNFSYPIQKIDSNKMTVFTTVMPGIILRVDDKNYLSVNTGIVTDFFNFKKIHGSIGFSYKYIVKKSTFFNKTPLTVRIILSTLGLVNVQVGVQKNISKLFK